jgi:hypothetical protein
MGDYVIGADEYWTFLHEEGHAHSYDNDYEVKDEDREEKFAWDYAYSKIASEYGFMPLNYFKRGIYMLSTYIGKSNARKHFEHLRRKYKVPVEDKEIDEATE